MPTSQSFPRFVLIASAAILIAPPLLPRASAVSDAEFQALKSVVEEQRREIAALKKGRNQTSPKTSKGGDAAEKPQRAAGPGKAGKITNPFAPVESEAGGGMSGAGAKAGGPASTKAASISAPDGKSGTGTTTNGSNSFFEVPDSPAAAILGVSPEHVVRPSTPQQLIPSILNGVDSHGNLKTGVAIDYAPFQTFGIHNSPNYLTDDLGGAVTRWLTSTQLSLATAKGTGTTEDKTMNIALGVQTTLFNGNDPVRKTDTIRNPAAPSAAPAHQDYLNQLGVSNDQRLALRSQETNAEHWFERWTHNSAMDVGAAQVWTAQDGTSSHFNNAGYALYSTYSYGLEILDGAAAAAPSTPASGGTLAQVLQRNTQLLLQGSYRNGELVANPAKGKASGPLLKEDTTGGSLRLKFGSVKLNGSLIETIQNEHLTGHSDKLSHTTQFALEWYMGGNVWLTATMGKEFDNVDGKNPVIALGGFKFGEDTTAPK